MRLPPELQKILDETPEIDTQKVAAQIRADIKREETPMNNYHDKTWNPVTIKDGVVECHDDRLDQPLRWRKPRTIFVNSMGDLFHKDVPFGFVMRVLNVIACCPQHTFIVLTKRPGRARNFFTQWGDLTGEDYEPKLVRGPEETRKAHPSGRGQLFADMLVSMGTPPEGCAYPTFDWMGGMIAWPSVFGNLILGVSCSNQQDADRDIPILLDTPAACRCVSLEPLLGPVSLRIEDEETGTLYNALTGEFSGNDERGPRLDWVIVGGETGANARPMYSTWVRGLRDQCKAAGTAFFFKQWGEWCANFELPDGVCDSVDEIKNLRGPDVWEGPAQRDPCPVYRVGKARAGHLLDGKAHREVPEVLK